jgi:putative endonuclease
MVDARRIFGDSAEGLAADYLVRAGLQIIERQYSSKMGEIDLIAMDGREVVFVEVKARKTAEFGYPEEAVTPSKLRKIGNTAMGYLRRHGLESADYRIDVVAIEFNIDPPRITHIKGVY